MDMEIKKIGESLPAILKEIAERAEANKGYEYENHFVVVSHAVVRAKHVKKIGLRTFALFLVIRTFMNQNRIAFPKLETICYYSGLSPNTAQKDINKLIKYGWIQKTVTRNKNGKFEVAKYLILQRDLVRGSGDPSFKKKPVSRIDNGD